MIRAIYRSRLFRPVREKLSYIAQLHQQRDAELQQQLKRLHGRIDDLVRTIGYLRFPLSGQGDAPASTPSAGPGFRSVTGPDTTAFLRNVGENYRTLADSFDSYRQLILALSSCDRLRLLPLYRFAQQAGNEYIWLGLRHDIDADPITALRMARFLASRGVCGSFYLLHTAGYFGTLVDGLFIRNPDLEQWIKAFIIAGCELGIHNDAFGAAQIPFVDGARAFEEQLEWMRSLGATIRGSVAHNSAPAYGAENSEVFVGRRLWHRDPVSPNGALLPLEALNEESLGLSYEGSFALPKADVDTKLAEQFANNLADADIRNKEWMRTYLVNNPCCDWGVDVQIWHVGRNQWVVGGCSGDQPMFEWKLSLADLINLVRGLPLGTRALMVLHPVYVRAD